MILINPVEINETRLISSTIDEPDLTQGEAEWSAGTYNLGDRVIKVSTHSVYEVVADPSTTDDPESGILKDPQTWVRVGPTNRYKMFDEANNTGSVGTNLTVEITPTDLINSLACFNVACNSVIITAYDNAGNQTYTNTINMRTRPNVDGWYNYFYSGFSASSKFIDLSLPQITRGKLKVEFQGEDAVVGTFVVGKQESIGNTQWGSGGELLDYSTETEDEYGNLETLKVGYKADLIDYAIQIKTSEVDDAYSSLKSLGTTTPTVFIGKEDNLTGVTSTYGKIRTCRMSYAGYTISTISLTVRELT